MNENQCLIQKEIHRNMSWQVFLSLTNVYIWELYVQFNK